MIIITALLQIYIDHFRFKKDSILFAHAANIAIKPVRTVSEEHAIAGPELGNTSGFHEQAFDHPALWKKQPVVWIAQDPLGIGKFQTERINAEHVEASTEFAQMDEKATVMVERGPPDEAWYGGFTAH